MTDDEKTAISARLVGLIAALAPDANLRPMYGGAVIELETDNPKSRVGGIYAYADYVTLELAKGADFEDPNRVLEGGGKARRHVKLRTLEDVETKTCQSFLEQAVTRPT